MSEDCLRGNGALLVRERSLAARVQRALERLYRIDPTHDVGPFLARAEAGEREVVLVRESIDGLEVSVLVPSLDDRNDLDSLCQIIEGVSHFVLLAHRAREDRETTVLELEMQAEVDKYVVIAESINVAEERRSARLRERLFDDVRFLHHEETDLGERYRVANRTAQSFVRRLEERFVAHARFAEMHEALRAFFHAGQEDKLRLAVS